jgi:hypothetical protein
VFLDDHDSANLRYLRIKGGLKNADRQGNVSADQK